MRWMHLSDIHYNPNKEINRSTKQTRNKLINYIKDNQIEVDELFITGDFRNALAPCNNEQQLVDETIGFINNIANSVGISHPSHIHIVPGNHDLNRCELIPTLDEIRENYDWNDGNFEPNEYKQLISRFGFYNHIYNDLHYDEEPISTDKLLLHSSKCYSDYALVYLNTAISCGNDNDRGSLVIGNSELYSQLESIKSRNANIPIIVLAHHSQELFKPKEKAVIQKLFLDYNVMIYLCGDAHEISCGKINNVLEYISGCMTYDKDVHITFACGELLKNDHDITSYVWDSYSMQWGIYDTFNQHYKKVSNKKQILPESSVSLFLNDDWFEEQNKSQISNLGPRYSPKVNVETNFTQIFDFIAKNNFFKNDFIKKSDVTIQNLRKIENDEIKALTQQLIDEIKNLNLSADITTDFDKIASLIERAKKSIFDKILDVEKQNHPNSETIADLRKNLEIMDKITENYMEYLNSNEIKLANTPICILSGDGGIGKSHLIADTVEKRNVFHEKSVLLLGQHFNNIEHPFEQIIKLLNLDCSVDEMLIQFNEIGKQQSTRLIIFIDAINEGGGTTVWKSYLQGMILKINKYSYIGLVLSVRSHYIVSLYRDNKISELSVEVIHKGFALNGFEAAKKYFQHYDIKYNDVPLSNKDFYNPLFLKLFCETYKNQSVKSQDITLSKVYLNYIKEINRQIAEKCKYGEYMNAVKDVLELIARERYSKNNFSNIISIDTIVQIINGIEQKYKIHYSLLDEMLSLGILTKDINIYDDEERIFITFEKLEDYLYSEFLVSSIIKKGFVTFEVENKNISHRIDLMEFFSVLLAEKTDYEIFQVFTEDSSEIRNAFIGGLKWRQADSITKKTIEFINNTIVKYSYSFKSFVETLILLSTKKNHPLNAQLTANYIMSHSMPSRDALFIEIFDNAFQGDNSIIDSLLDWCLNKNNTVDHETIKLAAKMISLFFISPNNTLRDKSTKALISLLNGKTGILLETLEYYKDANDPYIMERVYAVAFGCVVREKDKAEIKSLALAIYENVFNKEDVYPNVLVRDYAKNVVDYAVSVLGHLDIDMIKIIPPYKSQFPTIPTDEEIEEYNIDSNSDQFKEHYYSQNSILHSMSVEYTRDGQPGGYGDFGRYVFQRYFDSWKQLEPNDLMNIAVKKVFDMGYDKEKHGKYDRNLRNNYQFTNKNERIGKKYQWIALYELAAQVSDNYKLEQHLYNDNNQTTIETYCKGSFEPPIRNIDPTISHAFFVKDTDFTPIHDDLYDISNKEVEEWISDLSDLPNSYSMLHKKKEDNEFILLNGWYKWAEEKQLGFEKYEQPQKDMWININCYIVKKDQLNKYVDTLKGENFIGKRLNEPTQSSMLFNREYYWSSANQELNKHNNGCVEIDRISNHNSKFNSLDKVLIPTYIYYSENQGDIDLRRSWYKPCDKLFNELNLKYGYEDTALYNSDGKLICFDSQELLNEDIGFFISKDIFFKYLEDNNYTCFWTILAQKQIIGGRRIVRSNFQNIIKSGLIYFDDSKNIVEHLKVFKSQ